MRFAPRASSMRMCARLAAALAVLPASVASAQGGPCGDPFRNHYGPFDYNTTTQEQRELVEKFHFTEQVATLRAGESTTKIGADIAYTLRVFPNHPRALMAMALLAQREKSDTPVGAALPVSCWFERAITFRPKDATVRLVYGTALSRENNQAAALEQFRRGLELAPDNANLHYNIGLTYFELKDYDDALVHAKRAYELGFPLPGLRNKLQAAKRWK